MLEATARDSEWRCLVVSSAAREGVQLLLTHCCGYLIDVNLGTCKQGHRQSGGPPLCCVW